MGRTRVYLVIIALASCAGLAALWYWQRIVMPPQWTTLYGKELGTAIALFHQNEGSLETQLHPERILEVATQDYMPIYRAQIAGLHCGSCSRWRVTTGAHLTETCVLSYTPGESQIRVTIREDGHWVDATTHAILPGDGSRLTRSTYLLVREQETWKVSRITAFKAASKGKPEGQAADVLYLLREELEELGCP